MINLVFASVSTHNSHSVPGRTHTRMRILTCIVWGHQTDKRIGSEHQPGVYVNGQLIRPALCAIVADTFVLLLESVRPEHRVIAVCTVIPEPRLFRFACVRSINVAGAQPCGMMCRAAKLHCRKWRIIRAVYVCVWMLCTFLVCVCLLCVYVCVSTDKALSKKVERMQWEGTPLIGNNRFIIVTAIYRIENTLSGIFSFKY